MIDRKFKGISEQSPHRRDILIIKDDAPQRKLSPKASQRIKNHSPDGFNWGYAGSGPAQLALALILEVSGREAALRCYHQFELDFELF